MILTRTRLVSLTKTIAHTTTTNILILVLMLLLSVPVTVDSYLSSSSDPPPSCTTHPNSIAPTHLPLSHTTLSFSSRLKSRYYSTSCTFSRQLFLTSYMISLRFTCGDTYSNKLVSLI